MQQHTQLVQKREETIKSAVLLHPRWKCRSLPCLPCLPCLRELMCVEREISTHKKVISVARRRSIHLLVFSWLGPQWTLSFSKSVKIEREGEKNSSEMGLRKDSGKRNVMKSSCSFYWRLGLAAKSWPYSDHSKKRLAQETTSEYN